MNIVREDVEQPPPVDNGDDETDVPLEKIEDINHAEMLEDDYYDQEESQAPSVFIVDHNGAVLAQIPHSQQ